MNINENLQKWSKIIKKKNINEHNSAQKHHQTTTVASFVSSVIQFYMFFHPVILYENYLICIFMNINENFCNERKILEKLRDVHIKWQIFHLPCVPVYQT